MNNNIILQDENEDVNSHPEAAGGDILSLAMKTGMEYITSTKSDYQQTLKRRAEQQEIISKIINDLKKKYPDNVPKPEYPLIKERAMLTAICRGERDETKKLLNELLAVTIFSNTDQFTSIQLRFAELVVLISRIEINYIKDCVFSIEANFQSLKKVMETKTVEEIIDILHITTDRVLKYVSSIKQIPHAAALRKAETFINKNFTRKISLKEIASTAGLSPPYFSTIFKEETGENLSKYLNRLRVEKAIKLLLETDMTLSEIAACCCFEDQSWFSKIFKTFTGTSPGKYRNHGGNSLIARG